MNRLPSLFDANGRFGSTSSQAPAFARAQDLLAHLDRLGVRRALVWNTEAAAGNCPLANRQLLNRIARTRGAKGRLIPALAFSPTMLYERGAVEGLERMLRSTGVPALRLPGNVSGPHTLRHTEPIIESVSAANPTIFLNNNDVDGPDLMALAERFPSVSFVVTQTMWPRYVFVFDLMRRCKNVLIESSWLHTMGTIELLVKEFGADRIVFGLGDKSHNGASIAALAHSRISGEEREMIAHGNMERLLRSKPTAARPAKGIASKTDTLWSRLLQGRKPGVNIVDAHVHLGPGGGFALEQQSMAGQISIALEEARKFGISAMLVSGAQALAADPVTGNRALEKQLRPYGRRFRGYLAFNPHYEKELARRLDAFFASGFFVGFKTLCDYWRVPVTDARFSAMLEYADRHRLPILNHTWTGSYDSPAMFSDIVKSYPNAIFLLGHSGGTDAGRRHAEELAAGNDNVYLEWCGSFCSSTLWEETLAKVGADRVVYGSDGMSHGIAWELGRLLSVNLPDATIRPILGDNMRRILALRRD